MKINEQKKVITGINEIIIKCGKIASKLRQEYNSTNIPNSDIIKSDNSLLTTAELKISDVSSRRLTELLPSSKIIDEESTEKEDITALFEEQFLWAKDPVDATLNYRSCFSVEWGISIGLLEKKEKGHVPILGSIYFPEKDQLFYTDGKNSFRVIDASKKSHRRIEKLTPFIYKTEMDFSSRAFTISERQLTEGYDFNNIWRYIRIPGCSLTQLNSISENKSFGTIQCAFIWDIAAALAIGNPVGLKMWDMQTGQNVDYLTSDLFSFTSPNYFKLKKDYAVSNDSAKGKIKEMFNLGF